MQLGGPYDPGGGTGVGGEVVAAGPGVGSDGSDLVVSGCDAAGSGARGAGEPCTSAADCALACCGADASQWSGASCVAGTCAAAEIVCGRTNPPPPADESNAPPCDTCVAASCASEQSACAGDPACSGLESCRAGCSDDECLAHCVDTEGSSPTADLLDACVSSRCASECP